MSKSITIRASWLMLFVTLLWGAMPQASLALPGGERYDPGTYTVQDIWIDPVNGRDENNGRSRDQAVQRILAAWRLIPEGTLTGTGYRLRLMPGNHVGAYLEDRHGTQAFPIIIEPADGRNTAKIAPDAAEGPRPLQIIGSSYVYVQDFEIRLETAAEPGDAFQCERCDHVLLRRMTIRSRNRVAQTETVKLNQSDYVYLEDNDIAGAGDNAIDAVGLHHGHVVGNKIHDAADWCAYIKGGSAYFRVEGNEIYDCGTGGFTAGQGSGFQFMVSPWLHYEAYDLKIINNLIHDTAGACLGVNGGYNILLAYNTCYKVGQRSHVVEFVHGRRACDGDDVANCQPRLNAGGWGRLTAEELDFIPNRNIYFYNNLIYNPSGYQSQQHFEIRGNVTPPADSHVPSPAQADNNLQIKGNVIWNGPSDLALGIEETARGCQNSNPTCNAAQLRVDNRINTLEPQLVDPAHGNFAPTTNSNLLTVAAQTIPPFSWSDAPNPPTVPTGQLSNNVSLDYQGNTRNGGVGALVSNSGTQATVTPMITNTPRPNQTGNVLVYLPLIMKQIPDEPPTATATIPAEVTPTATVSSGGGTPLPSGAITMVSLGDSLTEGAGDDNALGYPGRLLPLVQARRPNSTMTNYGKSGWSSNDLINGLNGEASQLTPAVNLLNQASGAKVAFVWIGSNDLWYLYEFGPDPMTLEAEADDLQNFTQNIDKILSQLTATGAKVYIALGDDQSKRPCVANPNPAEPAFPNTTAQDRALMSAQITRYNNAIQAKAAQYGATAVDFYHTTIFVDAATLAGDGNHPNATGYDQITTIWFNALQPTLRGR